MLKNGDLCLHVCPDADTHLHTVVTDAAVRAARRPVEVTGGAPLHPDLNALDLHVLVERRSEIIVLVLVLVRCGETGLRMRRTEKLHHSRYIELNNHP